MDSNSATLCDRLSRDIWWYLGVIILLGIVYYLGKSQSCKGKGKGKDKKEKFEECSEDGNGYKCVDGQKVFETFEECSADGSDYKCIDGQKVYDTFSECEEDSEYECVNEVRVLRAK